MTEFTDYPEIPFIQGDGIGPEVWRASCPVLDAAVEIAFDGRRAVVQNAYHLLRGVSVPKGRHQVVFVYWPVSFQVGLALCVGSALLTALGGLATWLRSRRRRWGPTPRGVASP